MNSRLGAACSIAAVVLASAVAAAHSIPGVKKIAPGQAFTVASMRGLVVEADGRYHRKGIDLNAARDGAAWAFLVIDPLAPKSLAEAHRFEAVLKTLPHTHGFLVLTPAQSMMMDHMADVMSKSGLTTQTILDEHDIFPFVFRHKLNDTPRYELLDGSQTLVIQNAVHLRDKAPDGETFAELLKRLDHGEAVAPLVVSVVDQNDEQNEE